MIKAKELRINNKLIYSSLKDYLKDKYFTVKLVSEAYLIDEDDTTIWYYEVKPIPLTEEILLKCGFYIENSKDRLSIEAWSPGHPSQRFNIDFKDGKILLQSRYQDNCGDNLYMNHIEHLHQLQNLYFSLTNKELEIKL